MQLCACGRERPESHLNPGKAGNSGEGNRIQRGHLLNRLSFQLRALSQSIGLWGAWSKLSCLLELHSFLGGQRRAPLLRKQPCGGSHRSIDEF